MDLFRRSLCEDAQDYEGLLENMSVVMATLDCEENGNIVESQPGVMILSKLFNDVDGLWKPANVSCFSDRKVFYYDKSCNMASKPYEPSSGENLCSESSISIACNPCDPIVEFTNTDNTATVSVQGVGALVSQSTLAVAEQTDFSFASDTMIGDYVIMYSHCNTVKYVFYFGTRPTIPGVVDGDNILFVSLGGATNALSSATILQAGINDQTGVFTVGSITGTGPYIFSVTTDTSLAPDLVTFKQLADLYSCYLGCLTGETSLEDLQKVVLAICDLLKDRIKFDRTINKTFITIGKCDL
jgi:hypothetical protein